MKDNKTCDIMKIVSDDLSNVGNFGEFLCLMNGVQLA